MKTPLRLLAVASLILAAGCTPVTTQTPDVGSGPPGGDSNPAAIGTAGGGFPVGGGSR